MSALIGNRWTPKRIVRRDDENGLFEEINPSMTPEDLHVQRALIEKPMPRGTPWVLWWTLISIAALAAAWRFK